MQTAIKNPNWWRRRTTLERCLSLITIFAFIIITGLVVGLVCVILSNEKAEELNRPQSLHGSSNRHTQNEIPGRNIKPDNKGNDDDDLCLEPECIYAASSVLSKMKPEVEPCDDFYEFVCGSYLEEETIPDDKTSVSTFSVISDQVQQQLKDIIAEERPATDPEHFLLPNKFYKACMNKSLIEERGIKPIQAIADSLGGWPLLKGAAWDPDNTWTWEGAVKDFRRLGLSIDYIMSFGIGVDFKNTTQRIIDFDEASIALGREYLIKGLNETFVSAYYDYMVDIAVLFGADRSLAKTELMDALQFEIDLANISLPMEKKRNSSEMVNKRTIKQAQQTYPFFNWLDYINALLPAGLQVDENEEINISSLQFMSDLGKLLAKTPKKTIANYMMWRIHALSVSFLPEEFRKRQLKYSTVVSGRQEQQARWKECVDMIDGGVEEAEYGVWNGFRVSVGSLYVRKHFQKESKQIASEMVENIRNTFDEMLTAIDWMDAKTKAQAKHKLSAMHKHIGYPDEILNDTKLAEHYRGLYVDSDKYFESYLNLSVYATDYSFNKLREPVNKTDWTRHSTPAVVNAFYSFIENSIQFPAGILQGHFFNALRPKYMNYGSIGFVIGHEITHGFDDQGRQFDLDGNLVDWWEKDTQDAYLMKAQCIIEQYGNYTERTTGLKLNGINTQGENIADNGGLKESYLAYRKWMAKNGPEPKLPGLEYTPEQMFWISAGQTWCSKNRIASMKNSVTTGVHSPSEFRVLGVMSNMQEFARDFQCPEGSVMNPLKKCEVW